MLFAMKRYEKIGVLRASMIRRGWIELSSFQDFSGLVSVTQCDLVDDRVKYDYRACFETCVVVVYNKVEFGELKNVIISNFFF